MSQLSARAKRLVRAVEARWGVGRWHAAMARALGLSQAYVTLMAKAGDGGRPVTDEVGKALLRTLQQERKNLKAMSAELAETKKDMDDE